jgi:hypothetical protein
MTIKRVIWCDECGAEFPDEKSTESHQDENCVPYKIGDRVTFPYQILTFPGTITGFGDLVGPGGSRIAYIKSDEQIEEPDGMAITGYDFYASISELQAL